MIQYRERRQHDSRCRGAATSASIAALDRKRTNSLSTVPSTTHPGSTGAARLSPDERPAPLSRSRDGKGPGEVGTLGSSSNTEPHVACQEFIRATTLVGPGRARSSIEGKLQPLLGRRIEQRYLADVERKTHLAG